MNHHRREWLLWAVLLLIAAGLRIAAVIYFSDDLSIDRDAYLGIAESLADGRGFASKGFTQPTAFRPPLYPLMLAGVLRMGGGPWAIGSLQIGLGVATVLVVAIAARRMGLGHAAFIAAGLLAVDPLLIRYTPMLMTETLCTLLVACLIAVVAVPDAETRENSGELAVSNPQRLWRSALGGLFFGLAALCRPTFWAFGVVYACGWILLRIAKGWRDRAAWSRAAAFVFIATLTVAPWAIRNKLVFGRPIITTTHGGYTLLLANNPVFFREVVEQPWGAVWQGESLAAWQASVDAEAASVGVHGEVDRDKWMARRARDFISDTIREQPGLFIRACLLRVGNFWNVAPLGEARSNLPAVAIWVTAGFYIVEFVAMLIGILLCIRQRQRGTLVLVSLVIAFTAVHLLYWTNARMRAPILPAVALLATIAVSAFETRNSRRREG